LYIGLSPHVRGQQLRYDLLLITPQQFNPLTGKLKPQSKGSLYSNTMIGTLAVDGWAVTFGTARRGLGGAEGPGRAGAPPSPLLAVPNVTAHPSTASVPTLYYSMWHYNCRCPTAH